MVTHDLFNRRSSLRILRGLVLGLVALLIAARPYGFPSVNLDSSWGTGLVLGRIDGLKWGRQLDFTYGPWGWLSVHIAISRMYFALSVLFTIAVSGYLVFVLWTLLRRSISDGGSLLVLVFVALPFFSQVSITEVFLAAIFGSYVIILDRSNRGQIESWKTVVLLTMPVALVVQLKISLGIFAIVGLLVISAIWWSSSRLLIWCFGSLLSWFLIFWWVSEQSLNGLSEWLTTSLDVAGGFASAMSMNLGHIGALLLFATFSAGTALLLFRKIRAEKLPRFNCMIAFVLVGVMLYSALKTGYIREEQFRILDGYALCLPMWIWLLSPLKRQLVRYLVLAFPVIIGLSFLMGQRPAVRSIGGLFDWTARVNVWADNSTLLVSESTFERRASDARLQAQQVYGLSDAMVENLRDAAVQVDPYETTLVWAYGLKWKPVPIFQTYQAYTPGLDGVNTAALEKRGSRDVVLIEANQVRNINGRLSLWTPPRYQLALTCSWELLQHDDRWEEWGKSNDRCSSPEEVSVVSLAANASVGVPRAASNEIVVAKFERKSSVFGVFTKAFQFFYKPLDQFEIQLDGTRYNQPRAFDGSPLLVSCPPQSSSTSRFAAVCPSPNTMTFSESGTVTFERLTVRSR